MSGIVSLVCVLEESGHTEGDVLIRTIGMMFALRERRREMVRVSAAICLRRKRGGG